jgi:hypothetical protein
MEAWYTKLRNFKDESERPYITEKFCQQIFHELNRSKIREKKKFVERTGTEFDAWTLKLEDTYPKELVRTILGDDDFWKLTLKVTGVL